MKRAFLLLILLIVSGFSLGQKKDEELKKLADWMAGSWDTFKQADEDEEEDAPYKHVRAILHVIPIEIPELAEKGFVFYVENQLAEERKRPYRQRVYWLFRADDGRITLRIFKISNEKDFVNAHKNPQALQSLTFERLSVEEGCDLIYEKINDELYRGRLLKDRACKSKFRGATYVHSESELSPNRWMNLDQGFDDEGNHRWGPPPGTVGHIFLKRK